MARHPYRRMFILWAIIGGALLGTPRPSWACEPSVPAPQWYDVIPTFDPPPLPAGVTVDAEVPAPDGVALLLAQINNTTTTPLYAIGYAWGDNAYEPIGLTFRDGAGPLEKVVSGTAWVWTPSLNDDEHWSTWQRSGEAIDLGIGRSLIHMNWGFGPGYITENPHRGERPADTIPPPPERVEVPLVYGTTRITLPVTISYTLNPDYTLAAVAEHEAICSPIPRSATTLAPAWQINWGDVLVVGEVLVIILFGIIMWRHAKETDAGPPGHDQ
jgi:hypothetical protein